MGFPLKGTLVLSFGVDESGAPVNPQVLRSTLPEANLQVLAQAAPVAVSGVQRSRSRRGSR